MSGQAGEKTVRVTIDGNEYTFPEGMTILKAAQSVGIEIAHYCFHPGLSIAGACRMCLVEVEKIPKLQISCYITVSDGMVVHTSTERVIRARRAQLEFHLVNHPLDCPVCDQAGECYLQMYYMTYGLYLSRVRENKVKKTKKAVQIGPHIMLDQERCILCSRCVRFCREISKSSELGFFNRGDREELDIFPGRRVDNPYSANVVDICPVGALTEKDSRFKVRVWYLHTANSICPRCSRGCNIYVDHNPDRPYKDEGRRICRLRPRANLSVNDYWMCDEGRYCFRSVDDPDRLTGPEVRRDSENPRPGWQAALDLAAERLSSVAGAKDIDAAVLVSPQASNEELHLLRRVIDERLPGCRVAFTAANAFEPTEDSLLRKADKNPNTRGAQLIGLAEDAEQVTGIEALKQEALAGRIGALLICCHDLLGLPPELSAGWAEALDRIPDVIFLGVNRSATSDRASIVLPAAAFAEREGTVTNFASRIQLQERVFDPLGEALPGWEIIRRLGEALGGLYDFDSARAVFADLGSVNPAFAGLDYEKIGPGGCPANGHLEKK
jgi:NADH-quinone oxidoreductase subunit G